MPKVKKLLSKVQRMKQPSKVIRQFIDFPVEVLLGGIF